LGGGSLSSCHSLPMSVVWERGTSGSSPHTHQPIFGSGSLAHTMYYPRGIPSFPSTSSLVGRLVGDVSGLLKGRCPAPHPPPSSRGEGGGGGCPEPHPGGGGRLPPNPFGSRRWDFPPFQNGLYFPFWSPIFGSPGTPGHAVSNMGGWVGAPRTPHQELNPSLIVSPRLSRPNTRVH